MLLVLPFITFPPNQCSPQIVRKGNRQVFSLPFVLLIFRNDNIYKQANALENGILCILTYHASAAYLVSCFCFISLVLIPVNCSCSFNCLSQYSSLEKGLVLFFNCILIPVSFWHKSDFKNSVVYIYSVVCIFLRKKNQECTGLLINKVSDDLIIMKLLSQTPFYFLLLC